MFARDNRFKEVLKYLVEARLHNDGYTGDGLSAAALETQALQDRYVGHRGLPYYLVMDPSSQEILARHELAPFNQDTHLLAFLEQGLETYRARQGP